MSLAFCYLVVFFFNVAATTEIYTLSLHDALPILSDGLRLRAVGGPLRDDPGAHACSVRFAAVLGIDRKSTRLNSSHRTISYAVFCLKKKKIAIEQGIAGSVYDYRAVNQHADALCH